MLRVPTTSRQGSFSRGAAQTGFPATSWFGGDYTIYEFSLSFDLDTIVDIANAPQQTVNVANFINATLCPYFRFENAIFAQYKPGRQFVIGLHGTL